MKVTIITVCYNSEATIEETIQSVLQQTHKNIEYIIIDGKSTDNTINIINKYASQISLVVSQKDEGIYDAMNKGIFFASGDIVGILNSDDVYFDSEIIEKIVTTFTTKKVDCVYGNIHFFRKNTANIVRIWRTKPISKYYFELGNIPPHPSLFVLKSVYNTIGGYNTSFKIGADHEFIIRLLKKNEYKSYHINEIIIKMRVGGVSTSGIKSILISTKEIKKAWNLNGFNYPVWLYILRPIKKISELITARIIHN